MYSILIRTYGIRGLQDWEMVMDEKPAKQLFHTLTCRDNPVFAEQAIVLFTMLQGMLVQFAWVKGKGVTIFEGGIKKDSFLDFKASAEEYQAAMKVDTSVLTSCENLLFPAD